MDSAQIGFVAAFLAGLLSFFSPCVLPLVPAYLGYMTGTAVGLEEEKRRIRTLAHALFFALGFGAVFGTTVIARMALLVERLDFLWARWWPAVTGVFA